MLIASYLLALLSAVLLVLWIDSMDRAERYRKQPCEPWPVKPGMFVKQPPRELIPLVPTIVRKKHGRKR